MGTRLGHRPLLCELLCRDLGASERFWVDGVGSRVASRQGPMVWLEGEDGREVLLRPGRVGARAASYVEAGVGVVVFTDDLTALQARMTGVGAEPCGDDGGPACPLYRDPDGNWVQAVNPSSHGPGS